jgi:hypothetical protein
MDYSTLGYDNLLKKPNPVDFQDGINESNEDQLIGSGSVTWDKIDPNGDTPEAGADVTSENVAASIAGQGSLATLNQVDTAQIVDGAIEKVKMALLSVDSDILAANAVTSVKIEDNAISAPKILAGAVIAGKIAANAVTATEINVATLSAISANIGTITAGSITGVTITGGTIQTNSDNRTGVKMKDVTNYLQIYDGTIERMRLTSEKLIFYNTSATDVGRFYTDGTANMWLENSGSGYLVLKTEDSSLYGTACYSGVNPIWITSNLGISMQSGYPIRISSGNVFPASSYSYSVGTASAPFSTMYATTYYFDRSGYTEKYIQMASNGASIDVNHNFFVGGTLSKAAGSFRIDHPLKPDTHYLQHSFVESPEMLNIYTGEGEIVDGLCEIQMPDWFIALNGDNNFTYQLTPKHQNNLYVAEEMNKKGKVTFAGTKDGKFYYLITAVRHDKYALENPIEIEIKK